MIGSTVVLRLNTPQFNGCFALAVDRKRSCDRICVEIQSGMYQGRRILVKESSCVPAVEFVLSKIKRPPFNLPRLYARAAVQEPGERPNMFFGDSAFQQFTQRRSEIVDTWKKTTCADEDAVILSLGFCTHYFPYFEFHAYHVEDNDVAHQWHMGFYDRLGPNDKKELMDQLWDTYDFSYAAAVLYCSMHPTAKLLMGKVFVGRLPNGQSDFAFESLGGWKRPERVLECHRMCQELQVGTRVKLLWGKSHGVPAPLCYHPATIIDMDGEAVKIAFRLYPSRGEHDRALSVWPVQASQIVHVDVACRSVDPLCEMAFSMIDAASATQTAFERVCAQSWKGQCDYRAKLIANAQSSLRQGLECGQGCCMSSKEVVSLHSFEQYFAGAFRVQGSGEGKLLRRLLAETKLECAICMCVVEPEELFVTACGHPFHKTCMEKLQELSPSCVCPTCRQTV